MSTAHTAYRCKRCRRTIFRADQVDRVVELWDLGEYQAPCFVLSDDVDVSGLRRFDCSLHEGWYCCRFVAMRMVVDKFGTGRSLLVYADAVEAHDSHDSPATMREPAQRRLSAADFDAEVAAAADGELCVVKFGAIWCPPCRMMDRAIEQLAAGGELPGVRFFEVDVDEAPELAARFGVRGIPHFRFFEGGRPVAPPRRAGSPEGAVVGALSSAAFTGLCRDLAGAAAGSRRARAS